MRVALLGKGIPRDIAHAALLACGAEVITVIGDLLFVTEYDVGLCIGYDRLLPPEIVAAPPLGWFNIHSSLLPAYKGRAPLNWAIARGERELGVTLHRIDETIDGGEIVFQERFWLEVDEDVGDALERCYLIYERFVRQLVSMLDTPPANDPGGEPWPARTDADGEINWDDDPEDILNLIRASAPPYPGAWTMVGNRKLRILKARLD